MINDILDFSKMGVGKLELRSIDYDLRAMLRELIDSFVATAQGKGLVLSLQIADEVPIGLHGDMPRLRQVMTNLVGNAIKFTDSGTVSVAVGCRDGQRLCFTVQDTGIGIAPDESRFVFDAFSQADGSHTRRFGGTGLGLAISRQIVSLMGGEIRVDNTRASLAAPQSRPLAASTLRLQGHVLLVEDDVVNQLVARTFLEDLTLSIDVRALDALRDLPGSRGPQLVNKVIDAFLADTPARVGQLRSASVVGDAVALRRAAHALKSSSGFVGALRLVTLCKELETIDGGDVVERAPTVLSQVDAEVARVIQSLTSQRASNG